MEIRCNSSGNNNRNTSSANVTGVGGTNRAGGLVGSEKKEAEPTATTIQPEKTKTKSIKLIKSKFKKSQIYKNHGGHSPLRDPLCGIPALLWGWGVPKITLNPLPTL